MSYEREEEYLNKTLEIIDNQIKGKEQICEDGIERVRELSKFHWDYRSEMDDLEKTYSEFTINNEAKVTNNNLAYLRSLREVRKSPYFGKITVKYDEDE